MTGCSHALPGCNDQQPLPFQLAVTSSPCPSRLRLPAALARAAWASAVCGTSAPRRRTRGTTARRSWREGIGRGKKGGNRDRRPGPSPSPSLLTVAARRRCSPSLLAVAAHRRRRRRPSRLAVAPLRAGSGARARPRGELRRGSPSLLAVAVAVAPRRRRRPSRLAVALVRARQSAPAELPLTSGQDPRRGDGRESPRTGRPANAHRSLRNADRSPRQRGPVAPQRGPVAPQRGPVAPSARTGRPANADRSPTPRRRGSGGRSAFQYSRSYLSPSPWRTRDRQTRGRGAICGTSGAGGAPGILEGTILAAEREGREVRERFSSPPHGGREILRRQFRAETEGVGVVRGCSAARTGSAGLDTGSPPRNHRRQGPLSPAVPREGGRHQSVVRAAPRRPSGARPRRGCSTRREWGSQIGRGRPRGENGGGEARPRRFRCRRRARWVCGAVCCRRGRSPSMEWRSPSTG